ncbi:carboxyl-terminal processing protease [Flexibacter flexilis DSM 6793]|uniref:Carboxyl-terminal processing protease n=1 Tax=Flexibacter flexilis DSM 6793 TaxID=927664 RepID=A0A1I1GTH0_9BACT|nr:S41 family peptidase [Flexibacter flexilis]SFC14602.1 carboxyl-terminal processing protease [Flexibacter flexilis DSM 6793]
MEKISNSGSNIRIPVLLGVTLAGGILVGATLFGSKNAGDDLGKDINKLREIVTLIDREYVDTVNIDQITDYGINKMLENLDPHSAYIPAKEVELAKAPLEGEFDGIGIEFFILKDTIMVVSPISGGPSEAVGLRAGDKIVAVDDKTVAGTHLSNRDVFTKLRGKKGTKVKLSVARKGEKKLLDFVVTRDKIPTHSVDIGYMIDDKTGYIKVSRFSANTYNEFKEAMTKLVAKGMKQLVLDLRDNPGGYMDRATKMADEFLSGNKMIVYTNGKGERYDQQIRAYMPGDFEKGSVIVLINEGSASASEIVSGALQDNDRALIVGRRSFGKGLVQMPIPLSDGSELRLTISRYYTPSGRSIQKPYSKNEDEYNMDLAKRFENGEFFHADSIKFADSLRYKTIGGRTVYGGGGIMPDVFVPFDTSMNSRYLNGLYNKNIIREFSLDYADANKPTLSAMKFEDYAANFKVTPQMLESLKELATQNGLVYDEKQFTRSKPLIENALKAFIARNVWKDEGFYPVIAKQDDVLQKALTLFGKASDLEEGKFEKEKPVSPKSKNKPAPSKTKK